MNTTSNQATDAAELTPGYRTMNASRNPNRQQEKHEWRNVHAWTRE